MRSVPAPCLAIVLSSVAAARGELPLPSATVFGTVRDAGGALVGTGNLAGVVERDGGKVLEVGAGFVESDGEPIYVLRIPLESNIGAPGENGPCAREDDVLTRLVLDGKVLVAEAPLPALSMGLLVEIDARLGDVKTPLLFRGDCNGDQRADLSDAVAALNFLFTGGADPACLKACDIDGDRRILITDAVFLLNNLFLGGPPPAPPTGGCGPDVTPPEPVCEERTCPGSA